MPEANRADYLAGVVEMLKQHWPDNRTVNIVCHGHSVPAGYFATPVVDTFNAYPHLLHWMLKQRFPFAVINVIVTAVGGENSESGAERLNAEVFCHRPDVLTVDYGLNDRGIGLERAEAAWRSIIKCALERDIKVLLLTPTADVTQRRDAGLNERQNLQRQDLQRQDLQQHAAQIRALAQQYGIGLVDSLGAFERYCEDGGDLSDLLSWVNHPNRAGHELVARELLRWFPVA